MESLMKYVPFIDFVLGIDREKYIKFINIRKWIVSKKKKYPPSDLKKIEQSIITQYKNLLLENNVKIPKNIADIFAPVLLNEFVNLCSDDDEEDEAEVQKSNKEDDSKRKRKKSKRKRNKNHIKPNKDDDSDDDLEIISIDYVKPTEQNTVEQKPPTNQAKSNTGQVDNKQDVILVDLDEVSKELLNKINKLGEEDLKMKSFVHKPNNYTYQAKDYNHDGSKEKNESVEGTIYQRRTATEALFKRRTDFKEENSRQVKVEKIINTKYDYDEVEVKNLENNEKSTMYSKQSIDIITLDSCSDSETALSGDKEVAFYSKAAALKTQTSNKHEMEVMVMENQQKSEKEDANKGDSDNKKVELLCDSIESVLLDMSDVMDELKEAAQESDNKTVMPENDKECLENYSDKENAIELENLKNPKSIENLTHQKIFKLLSADIELETLHAALSHIKEANKGSKAATTENNAQLIIPAESPPPAPPLICNNLQSLPLYPLQQVHSSYPPAHNQTPNVCYPPPYVPQHQQQALTPTTIGSTFQNDSNTNWPKTVNSVPTVSTPQLTPPLTPHYAQNSSYAPTLGIAATRPKVNIKDPRIIKQLQVMQNSPLLTHNVLNAETADSIMKICQAQQLLTQQENFSTSITNPHNMQSTTTKNFPKSNHSITYGEYKRIQQEKLLETERQRELERKAKIEREEQELLRKKTEEIRSLIMPTVNFCKGQQNASSTTLNGTEESCKENHIQTPAEDHNVFEANSSGEEKKTNNAGPSTATKKASKPVKSNKESNTNKSNDINYKLNRVYNELKCTVKGFDQLQDYITNVDEESQDNVHTTTTTEAAFNAKKIGLRRRCSMHALSAITKQLGQQQFSDCSDSEMNQNKTKDKDSKENSNIRRRRCSMHADISQQLEQQSYDSDFELSQTSTKDEQPFTSSDAKRRSSEILNNTPSDTTTYSSPKRRRTIDEIIKPKRRANNILRIIDDEEDTATPSEDEDAVKRFTDNFMLKPAVVKLQRLTPDFMAQLTKRTRQETNQSAKIKTNSEPSQKLSKQLKFYNNDCQMTERNTWFCKLCRSKPSDLTNHYIGRHKTESYVSRLDWSELDDLQINTPFAKLQAKNKNSRFDRYEVECPFCKEKLIEPFLNLYQHYSVHTGEYAFQCSHCHLAKPYRPDIQSHILHSRNCRSANIQIMYRYPSNTLCIYLHYCAICNFVQLNEANVLKHLREHHNHKEAIASNVQKCILAAISDGPNVNETNKPATPKPVVAVKNKIPATKSVSTVQGQFSCKIKGVKPNVVVKLPGEVKETAVTTATFTSQLNFKVDDDDILVCNEPCLEDEDGDDKCNLEGQLKLLHEGPSTLSGNQQIPMTVIHCIGEEHLKVNTNCIITPATETTTPSATSTDRHLPMIIKTENTVVEENLLITPPRPSSLSLSNNKQQKEQQTLKQSVKNQHNIYEEYRHYPSNVNYLGLYKCMIDDCYYSTDCSNEMCQHLTEHLTEDLRPTESLQCPYCILAIDNRSMTPAQVVEHIREQHEHLIYQCSVCCYRSCDASNVHIHQQLLHNNALNACKIYKCPSGNESEVNNKSRLDLYEQIVKNIFKISCSICHSDFYNTQHIISHLKNVHNLLEADGLKVYSCIYCALTVANINQIRIHLAKKHPDELPLIYDRNKACNNMNEDAVSGLNIVNMAEVVTYEEIKSAVNHDESADENVCPDIKPDIKDLMQMNEETIRVRLRKLTAQTGIAPDQLYRCPVTACGGFFSIYDLWLKHMKVQHHSLECQCPHCNTPKLLTLNQFATHFEEHRRHTYICFHCPTTCTSEIIARQHAAEQHVNMNPMRFEKIRFNLSYSYFVMIAGNVLQERENFIAEFLKILAERLKELDSIESQKLKHQWPVVNNPMWLDDYRAQLNKRRVVRTCLMQDCNFRSTREEILFQHLRTCHDIKGGSTFNCTKCSYSIKLCHSFEEIFEHIKLHNGFVCICTACSLGTSSRSKMSVHIAEQHTARDVPVVQLFSSNHMLFIKIYIVFSDNHLTFSTMKRCFCCSEQNMEGDVFSLHLKRYHKFCLKYFCEKCPYYSFKSLQEVKPHFQQHHDSEKLKIRCEFASPYDLSVTSLNVFQVQISVKVQAPQVPSELRIKKEPSENNDDDDVIMLEDDDITIQDSLREEQLHNPKEVPKLKCASFSKLMETPTKGSESLTPSASPTQANISLLQQAFYQTPTPSLLNQQPIDSLGPSTSLEARKYGYQNLGAPTNNTNVSNSTTLSSMTPASETTSQNHNDKMTTRIVSLPAHTNVKIHPQNVANNLHLNQTTENSSSNPTNSTSIIIQNYCNRIIVPTTNEQKRYI